MSNIRRTVYLPDDLITWVESRADRKHGYAGHSGGGQFSAIVREILMFAREIEWEPGDEPEEG